MGGLIAVPLLSITADAEAAQSIPQLDTFIANYMKMMNAPGMIVATSDDENDSTVRSYGFADLEAQRAIRPSERFHIGSITKSFTALMVMQLVDEGKVRIDAPISDYLKGLPLLASFGPISVHDLLCHTGGLPTDSPAPGWPDQIIRQAYPPGAQFHYSNLGYIWLGQLVEAVGGSPWPKALHKRILDPLGMSETFSYIGGGMRGFEVPSYVPREDDRPYPRQGPVTRAPAIYFTWASGCIASTARDMARYISMLANHGTGVNGRVVSKESFAKMVQPHVVAKHFGPEASYGYGFVVDKLDGKTVIRHTGGMLSFMSSFHVDLESRYGAFASINAQLGYRPVPVTAYAIRLHRAEAAKLTLPSIPSANPDVDIVLADYAGIFVCEDGRQVKVSVAQRNLIVEMIGKTITLQSIGEDKFVCRDPNFCLFAFLFMRKKSADAAIEGEINPVAALGFARDLFVRPGMQPASIPGEGKAALSNDELASYEGFYALNFSGQTPVRIVVRNARLWLDGILPLSSIGNNQFRLADEKFSPETVTFTPQAPDGSRSVSVFSATLQRVGEPFMETL